MKASHLSRSLLICVAVVSCSLSAPIKAAPAKKAAVLPAEVRAMMSPCGTTVTMTALKVGNPKSPVLLHCWKMKRRSSEDASLLFCLDLFGKDSSRNVWQLVASVSYQGQEEMFPRATSYSTRWLHPATKSGLVIVQQTREPTDTLFRLITLPDWAGSSLGPSRTLNYNVQEFYADTAGPSNSSIEFGVDKSGGMTVERVVAPHLPVDPTRDIYSWNGGSWGIISSKRFKAW